MNDPQVKFVEGYVIFHGAALFRLGCHGWLELNGEIIDNYPNLKKQRFGIMYFPDTRYSFGEAVATWLQKKSPPFRISPKKMIYAIKTYHSAIRPKDYPFPLWNAQWFITGVKLITTAMGVKWGSEEKTTRCPGVSDCDWARVGYCSIFPARPRPKSHSVATSKP